MQSEYYVYLFQTTDIVRHYLNLHINASYTLLDASVIALIESTPIITPIWWYSPNDPEAYPIADRKFSK